MKEQARDTETNTGCIVAKFSVFLPPSGTPTFCRIHTFLPTFSYSFSVYDLHTQSYLTLVITAVE